MTIEVRPIQPDDELEPWLDAVSTGFLDRPDIPKLAEDVRTHWDFSRVWGAVEGGRVVGTTRTWATELTVPGCAQVKASAVSGVTVRAPHRRTGLLRRLLAAEHAAARERGELVSLLYASEYPIYGRFGYGVACQQAVLVLDVASTAFAPGAPSVEGSVDYVAIEESSVDLLRGVFDRWRKAQPGEIWRRPITYLDDLGLAGSAWGPAWKGFLVVHRTPAGDVDGYARFGGPAKWEHRQPRSTLTVNEVHGIDPDVRATLIRWLADVDLVSTVKIERSSAGDRLPWLLTNARAAELEEAGDGLWVRLHDIPAALEARTYERSGSVVVEAIVRDETGGDAPARRERVALDATTDGARAVATDRAPDVTVDAAALGAAYLGGTRLRHAVLAHGVDEHRPGALDALDGLLATRDLPWCSTFF